MSTTNSVVTRRVFFSWIAKGALWTTVAGFFVVIVKYLTPNVLFEPSSVFKIGKPENYPLDTVTFLPDRKLFVINREDGFSVLSGVCTHLGCTVNLTMDEQFHCPCHGSKFDRTGAVLTGPVQEPLAAFKVTLSRSGHMVVDIKKEVERSYRLV